MSRKHRKHDPLVEVHRENARLCEKLEMYERVIEAIPFGLWHRDLVTNDLWLSRSWGRSLGYSEQESPRTFQDILDLMHPEDIEPFQKAITEHLNGGTTHYENNFRIRAKNQSHQRTQATGRLFKGADQKPRWLAGYHRDFSDEEKQAKANRDRLAMFQRTFDSIPHLLLVKDEESRFVFVNEALARFYGAKSPSDAIGMTDADYNKNAEQVARFRVDDLKVIRSRKPLDFIKEVNTDAEGRKHYLHTIKVPLINPDGSVYVVVVATFIDQVVKLEAELHQRKLREARQRDMANLVRDLTHKLNSRIAALELDVFSLSGTDSDREGIQSKIEELKRFGEGFLDLATANRLQPKTTNLIAILRRALTLKGKGLTIFVNNTPWSNRAEAEDRFRLVADEDKLVDVFSELLSNATKWAQQQGLVIRIDLQALPKKPHPDFGPSSRPTKLRIQFKDNGPGVAPELKDILFEPFKSGRPDGFGIGLAMVREVIEAHGGDVNEIGTKDMGACFEIYLPTGKSSS